MPSLHLFLHVCIHSSLVKCSEILNHSFSVSVTERTLEEAVNSVTLADDTAYIRVQDGFSEALSRRLVALATLSNDSLLATDLDVGQLKVTMDATNMQVTSGSRSSL